MLSYNGEECIVCKKKFTDSDDIVACPDCGTPYHRECYKEKNECINYALHEAGGSWMANSRKNTVPDFLSGVKKVCPDCSFINPEDADVCRNCGAEIGERECKTIDLSNQKVVRIELDADADYFGMNPMEVMDEATGITIGEMGDYAKHNKLYYMLAFKKLKNATIRFSLNFAAFLFPDIYCAGRKMFLECFLFMLLRFFILIPLRIDDLIQVGEMGYYQMYPALFDYLAAHTFSQGVVNFTYAFDVALRIAFSLLANDFYYRHTIRKLKKLRKTVPDYLAYRNTIKTSGGLSAVGIVSILLVKFILSCLLILVLMIMSL